MPNWVTTIKAAPKVINALLISDGYPDGFKVDFNAIIILCLAQIIQIFDDDGVQQKFNHDAVARDLLPKHPKLDYDNVDTWIPALRETD